MPKGMPMITVGEQNGITDRAAEVNAIEYVRTLSMLTAP